MSEKIGQKHTDEQIKQQEEFVKAISYQKEAATNIYYDAKTYMEYLEERYNTEVETLNKLKEQNV